MVAAWSLQLTGMVAINVIRVFKQITGKNRYDIRVTPHDSGGGQAADSSQRCRRCRLAADARLADHGLGVGNFLLADFLDSALRFSHLFEGFGPRNGVADFDGGGERSEEHTSE